MRKTTRLTGLSFQNFFLFCQEEDIPALDTAMQFYEELDTAEALSCFLLIKYGEFRQIVEKKVRAIDFDDRRSYIFERSYQAVSYLSKYPFLPTGIDRTAVAMQSFLEAEERCKQTNSRLRRLRDSGQCPDLVGKVFHLAVGKVSRILGEFDYEEFLHSGGWGPGATNVAKGAHTSGYNKFSAPLSVTANCLPYAQACISTMPLWARYHSGETPDEVESSNPLTPLESVFEFVPGGDVRFVPKNAKTDRSIIIPVHLNSFCQKALGNMIKKRLDVAGVDLRFQTRNQQLALRGSQFNDLATIDLKAASDSIARLLVPLMVEDDRWYKALEGTREPCARLPDGRWVRFEKFSAMGNSFTFELETLIFYSLTWAAVQVHRESFGQSINPWTGKTYPWHVSAYGDDLICPVDCTETVLEVLSFFGFQPNMDKSFWDGPFRESCGKDYFAGRLVRPVFLKERLTNVEAIIRSANSFSRLGHRRNLGYGRDRRLRAIWLRLVHRLPSDLARRTGIPEGYGDAGLVKCWDEFHPAHAGRKIGWCGWWAVGIIHSPVKAKMWQIDPALLVYLQGSTELPREGQYDLRGRTKCSTKRMYVLDWADIGPWV
jgi:hypothetical protein